MDEMMDRIEEAPLTRYREYCRQGRLAYQVCGDTGRPVFYPRVISPYTGTSKLEWRESKGLGTVYSWTTVHRKGEAPYNVSLIDLDEGFRMMSRVECPDLSVIRVGLRVEMRMNHDQPDGPYPVFVPQETA